MSLLEGFAIVSLASAAIGAILDYVWQTTHHRNRHK